ncbi:MAG: hypothetical protein ACI8R9_000746 [Paraglaciecola sp.]|jgi:hypothetical protein
MAGSLFCAIRWNNSLGLVQLAGGNINQEEACRTLLAYIYMIGYMIGKKRGMSVDFDKIKP